MIEGVFQLSPRGGEEKNSQVKLIKLNQEIRLNQVRYKSNQRIELIKSNQGMGLIKSSHDIQL